MNRTGLKQILGAMTVLTILNTGCDSGSPTFSLSSTEDTFTQESLDNKYTKLDFLWMIDNSGSMSSSQTNIANNFSSFINLIQTKNYDFKMAVGASDGWRSLPGMGGSTNYSKFRDGNGTTHSGVFVLLPDTLNLASTFTTNVQLGISGTGDERAFQSIDAIFQNTFNDGFLRDDSFLAVIIVSDEDDFSHNGSNNISGGANPYANVNLHPVSNYVDVLDQATNTTGVNRRYNVSSIAVWDSTCQSALGSATRIGIRYGELSDLTGGIKEDICGDFAESLANIAENAVRLATQFKLNRIPVPSTIKVVINGIVVPNASTNPGPSTGGWTYKADNNSIEFSGDHVPEQGAKIKVTFDPASYGS